MWSDPIPRVTTAIGQRALCVSCIAANAFTHEADAEAALTTIARTVLVRWHEHARCQGCGEIGRVFSLDAPTR